MFSFLYGARLIKVKLYFTFDNTRTNIQTASPSEKEMRF